MAEKPVTHSDIQIPIKIDHFFYFQILNFKFIMAPLFANSLLQDIARLFTEPDDYDVLLEVGGRNDKKTFKAHSLILKTRSPYFKAALSSNWVKKENDKIIFAKPNITPIVFKKILK